jgi:hypothetical protein
VHERGSRSRVFLQAMQTEHTLVCACSLIDAVKLLYPILYWCWATAARTGSMRVKTAAMPL